MIRIIINNMEEKNKYEIIIINNIKIMMMIILKNIINLTMIHIIEIYD